RMALMGRYFPVLTDEAGVAAPWPLLPPDLAEPSQAHNMSALSCNLREQARSEIEERYGRPYWPSLRVPHLKAAADLSKRARLRYMLTFARSTEPIVGANCGSRRS